MTPRRRSPTPWSGSDLGVTSLAVLSTGEVIANPRHLQIAPRELRRLQRQASRRVGPDRRTRQVTSQRWRTTQARIARLHTADANARRDGLHTLTTRLVRTRGTIVIEDLRRGSPQPTRSTAWATCSSTATTTWKVPSAYSGALRAILLAHGSSGHICWKRWSRWTWRFSTTHGPTAPRGSPCHWRATALVGASATSRAWSPGSTARGPEWPLRTCTCPCR
jgi:hypothetical protein